MVTIETPAGMSLWSRIVKRSFDLSLALVGMVFLWWLILLAWVLAGLDTGRNGFFTQVRVGYRGKHFRVIKIRTMRVSDSTGTTVTTSADPRVTPLGRLLRTTKVDELPQLINVIFGQMSFVGPRPDVPGFSDLLMGDDRIILSVRPGITGPATLKYRREEEILADKEDPEAYNRDVIFPDKVRINRSYVENYRFTDDLKYIWQTVLGE
jgi:lipopolysaccharide/colanic/teichoic acid biosynthesis glycosyltransferase